MCEELNCDFDLASYLSLLLIKRQAFRHEQELRYFLVPEVAVGIRSRGDRYLSHSSRHTQVPVPLTTFIRFDWANADVLRAKLLYSGMKWDWNHHPN